jgi:hypothetical protein
VNSVVSKCSLSLAKISYNFHPRSEIYMCVFHFYNFNFSAPLFEAHVAGARRTLVCRGTWAESLSFKASGYYTGVPGLKPKLWIFPNECVFVLLTNLTVSSGCFPVRHSPIGIFNGSTLRSLWDTNWIVVYNVDWYWSLKSKTSYHYGNCVNNSEGNHVLIWRFTSIQYRGRPVRTRISLF